MAKWWCFQDRVMSRASRDEINDKVMKDPRLAEMMDPAKLPFDGKRMWRQECSR